jgi:hypothetical protein
MALALWKASRLQQSFAVVGFPFIEQNCLVNYAIGDRSSSLL